MKRIVVVVLLLSAIGFNAVGAGDVWQELKLGKEVAAKEVVSSFAYGNVSTYRVRDVFRNASPAVRTALVEQVLVWTRAYVNSPAFAKAYAQTREEAKPEPPEEQVSVDEELEQRRQQRKAELEEAKKSIAEMPAEYRKAAEEGYKAAAESMKQLDTPEFRKMERQGIEMERKSNQEAYEQQVADWEESYPADPKSLVKKRLEEFLEATEDVDYEARTVQKYNKLRFVDGEYESKGSEWKLAYRAGKEPTEKARAFAKAWLAELK
ncbi:MAG TPA: hypothetical protein VHW00_12490 [Thermoanaerobaculia bacterium]|nr:hypothetical protein [Thermoanaerobaculia bacterium]